MNFVIGKLAIDLHNIIIVLGTLTSQQKIAKINGSFQGDGHDTIIVYKLIKSLYGHMKPKHIMPIKNQQTSNSTKIDHQSFYGILYARWLESIFFFFYSLHRPIIHVGAVLNGGNNKS